MRASTKDWISRRASRRRSFELWPVLKRCHELFREADTAPRARLSVVDVDLVHISLRTLVTSVQQAKASPVHLLEQSRT